MPLPDRVVEDGFQVYQAWFGPTGQMESYYGSSPAAKRFEVTQCQRELQLPKGIVRTRNAQILCRGCGQLQEESFRRAPLFSETTGVARTGVERLPATRNFGEVAVR